MLSSISSFIISGTQVSNISSFQWAYLQTKSWTSTLGNHICWRQGYNDQFHPFHIFTTISMGIISLIFTCIHLQHKSGLLPSASQTKILIALKVFISVNSSCDTPNPSPPLQNAASSDIFRKCNPWGW